MRTKIISLLIISWLMVSFSGCSESNKNSDKTPSWVSEPQKSSNAVITESAISETIEYVSLNDIYDIEFTGSSPNLSIKYTPKVTHLPLWDGKDGNNYSQRQVKFLIEGEQYKEQANSDGSATWVKDVETRIDGKIKNGDVITLLPDKHLTNYNIEGDGSLVLGVENNIKYVLKDNVITVKGQDEITYKPELVTKELLDFFTEKVSEESNGVEERNFKYAFNNAGLIKNFSGFISNSGDTNITLDKKELVKVYLGYGEKTTYKYCLMLIFDVTMTQNTYEPVSAYVAFSLDNPTVYGENSDKTEKYEDHNMMNSHFGKAYKTIEECLSSEYEWQEVTVQ